MKKMIFLLVFVLCFFSVSSLSIDSVVLNTTTYKNGTGEDLTAWVSPYNSSLRYVYDWRINNNSIAVLNMPFDGEDNDESVADFSSYNISVVMGSVGSSDDPIYNSTGGYYRGGAYEFTGDNIRILKIDEGTALDDLGDNVTIAMWAKLNSYGDEVAALYQNWEDDDHRFQIYVSNNSGNISLYSEDGSGDDYYIFSNFTFPLDKWVHIAIIGEDDLWKIYANGELVMNEVAGVGNNALREGWTDLSRVSKHYFGCRRNGGYNFEWNGTIDEVMIFNRTLSSEQINLFYNNDTNVVSLEETEIMGNWSVDVTSFYNDSFGENSLSNKIMILPFIDSIILNTSSGINYDYEDLYSYLVNPLPITADIFYNWYKNESVVYRSFGPAGYLEEILDSDYTEKGTWKVGASAIEYINHYNISYLEYYDTFDYSDTVSLVFTTDFSEDGMMMFLSGDEGVTSFNLSSPFDITSAVKIDYVDLNRIIFDVKFVNGGMDMVIAQLGTFFIRSYSLSSPYNISSASSSSFSSVVDNPNGISFASSGSKMYISSDEADLLKQYDLSTPYDITTSNFVSETSIPNGAKGFFIKEDGSEVFVLFDDALRKYTLSIPYSITTINLIESFPHNYSNPNGFTSNDDGSRFFISSGMSGSEVYVYHTSYVLGAEVFSNEIEIRGEFPNIEVISPTQQAYSNDTIPIDLNISISDEGVDIDSCWFNINDGVNFSMLNDSAFDFYNVSTVFDDGNYVVNFYCNDTLGMVGTTQASVAVDSVPPIISLTAPLDESYSRENVTFEFTPIATLDITYCALWGTWNGGWHMNESWTDSGDDNVTRNTAKSYTVINLSTGEYNWSVECNNSAVPQIHDWSIQGNLTFSIDNLNPSVSIISPGNDSSMSDVSIDFEANLTDNMNLKNATLVIVNASNVSQVIYNLTEDFDDLIEETFEVAVVLVSGNYSWWMEVYDEASNYFVSDNYTLMVDVDSPEVNLIYPLDLEEVVDVDVDFEYIVYDLNGIDSCILFIDDSFAEFNSSVVMYDNSTNNTFSYIPDDGVHNWSVGCFDSFGNYFTSENEVFNFTNINDSAAPVFSWAGSTPSAVLSGENVSVDAMVSDNKILDSVWGVVTNPSGVNTSFSSLPFNFSGTSETGVYNLSFYANDSSGNNASSFTWFEVGDELNMTFNISVTSGNFTFRLIHPDFGDVIYETETNESFYSVVPDVLYDVMFVSAFDGGLNLTLKDVNLSLNINSSIELDMHNELSDYIVVYGVSTDYNFSSSELVFVYGESGYSVESNLRLWKCDGSDYDFATKVCSGSWVDISSGAVQNLTGNYFAYETTTFSGFAVDEYVAPVGDDDSGSSSSSGGGGGSDEVVSTVDDMKNESVYDNRSDVETGMPKELFDIRMDLEDVSLEFASELEAVVTYESFGSVPTLVNLTFEVFDVGGNLVYFREGFIVVTTEEVARYTFPDLNLSDGEYEFVFTTLYNVDVVDEFRNKFVVGVDERNLIFENWYWILIFIIGSILIFIFVVLLIKRKKKKN